MQQSAAFALAVNQLVTAVPNVVLHLLPGEVLVAEVAVDEAFGTSEAEMILHADSGDAGGALRGALDSVPLAYVEMRLQGLELFSPPTPFFGVDAVDPQTPDFGVRRNVGINYFGHSCHRGHCGSW